MAAGLIICILQSWFKQGFNYLPRTYVAEAIVMGLVALRGDCLTICKHCPESLNCSAGDTFQYYLSIAGDA